MAKTVGNKKAWVLVGVIGFGFVLGFGLLGLQKTKAISTVIDVKDINHSTVTINNQSGVPLDTLIELSKKLGVAENERDTWIKKYQKLESQLASRTDDVAKQAKAFLDKGQLEEAERLFKQALDNDLKNAASNAFSLANIKALQLNYPEAKRYYQQAVLLDPENALYLNDLGLHLHTMGEYTQVEPLYQRSLAIDEKALGKEHPDVATSLNNLVELYRTQGEYAKAEPLYQRSLAILEKTLGKKHRTTQTVRANLQALQAKVKQ